jgi:hypothetical protein
LAATSNASPQELQSIDVCLHRLDPQVDVGYERIAARCPDLTRQLERSSWAAWLPRGWKESGNDLSAGSLKELRALAARELAAHDSASAPDVGQLKSILVELDQGSPGSVGAWARFKTWLRSILQADERPDEGWLDRLTARSGSSQSLLELVSYAALAAVVVFAGFILANELRASGLLTGGIFGRGRRARPRAGAVVPGLGWLDVERASLGERPQLLLQLLAARLSEGGYLPPAGALTVRELMRVARLPDAVDRGRLECLALVAEQLRYSGHEISVAQLERPLAGGRELLEKLQGAGASQ